MPFENQVEDRFKKDHKCCNCEDRYNPDGYICEEECPYDDEGNLKG